jgi:hypothetical protein
MVVELIQTKTIAFDEAAPNVGSFPLRGGVTLIVSEPEIKDGIAGEPEVRYAIGKSLTGEEGKRRAARQREHYMAMGFLNGDTEKPSHFQIDFGLLHQGF